MSPWDRPIVRVVPGTDYTNSHAIAASEYILRAKLEECRQGLINSVIGKAESPLEQAFLTWWNALFVAGDIDERTYRLRQQVTVQIPPSLIQGARVEYRCDFVLQPINPVVCRRCNALLPEIAIELDGHDFHERTKEQVSARNQRDRHLQAIGFVVLHYSGSEFHNAPEMCVADAWSIATNLYDELIVLHAGHEAPQALEAVTVEVAERVPS